MTWFLLNHHQVYYSFLKKNCSVNPEITTNLPPRLRKERKKIVFFCACFLSLSEYLQSPGHQEESLLFHKAWPPKPVNELYLSFVSAPRLCFFTLARAPCQNFHRSHNVTDATHKSRGNKVWSLFLSSSAPLFLPPLPPSFPPFPWNPLNLFLSPPLFEPGMKLRWSI